MLKKSACACLVVLLAIGLCACSVDGEGHFLYREQGFCAEVRGRMRENEFTAVVGLTPTDGGYRVEVGYLSPATLEGLEVSAECDVGGKPCTNGRLFWEGHESDVDAETLAGLLLPACVLLGNAEIVSVRYEGAIRHLTLSNGITLCLGEDGMPQSLQSEAIFFDVIWSELKK